MWGLDRCGWLHKQQKERTRVVTTVFSVPSEGKWHFSIKAGWFSDNVSTLLGFVVDCFVGGTKTPDAVFLLEETEKGQATYSVEESEDSGAEGASQLKALTSHSGTEGTLWFDAQSPQVHTPTTSPRSTSHRPLPTHVPKRIPVPTSYRKCLRNLRSHTSC